MAMSKYEQALMRELRKKSAGMGADSPSLTQSQARNQRMNNQTVALKNRLNKQLPGFLKPGNVGNLNKVIWPFWFTVPALELAPGVSGLTSVTVSLEAAFVLMSITKVAFIKSGTDYIALDPDQPSNALSDANGVYFTVRDSQSSRVFTGSPVALDHIGHPEHPTVLPTPIMFLPNSNIEFSFNNNNVSATYVPWITLFGYRMRIDGQDSMLSTVSGY